MSPTRQGGNKKHDQCLTEFCLIIRLVYLWFATADWLFSCSEGVFPLQTQISPLISDCTLETSGDISIDEAGSVNRTSPTYSTPVYREISPILLSVQPPVSPPGSRPKLCVPQRLMSEWKWVLCAAEAGSGPINQGRIWIFPRLGQSHGREGGRCRDAWAVKVSTLLFRGKF